MAAFTSPATKEDYEANPNMECNICRSKKPPFWVHIVEGYICNECDEIEGIY